jgi:dsDNA-binding SOS-regulon protein
VHFVSHAGDEKKTFISHLEAGNLEKCGGDEKKTFISHREDSESKPCASTMWYFSV